MDPPPPATVASFFAALTAHPRALEAFAQVEGPSERDPNHLRSWLVTYCTDTGGRTLGIFKEANDRETASPCGESFQPEPEILTALATVAPGCAPRLVDTFTRNGRRYLLRRYTHGTPLQNAQHVAAPGVFAWAARVLRTLARAHAAGWVNADLSPGNVTTDGKIIDWGNAHFVGTQQDVRSWIMEPAYTPPEVWATGRVGAPNDVWQVGVMAAEQILGHHPFRPPYVAPTVPWSELILKGAHVADARLAPLLEADVAARPTAAQAVALLAPHGASSSWTYRPHGPNALWAWVPMRAGVPHRGHVRLLKTLWELGWRVVVDLHKVYTWTAADPLAKWTVAAMLRTALDAEGLPLEDFSFRYSKFDERSSMRMEVLMDAAWEKVDVVVSGNPEVLRFFEPLLIQGKTFLDARALCGDLTDFNGTRLRAAIASKNDALARTLLHPAVRARWSLEQLRAEFPRATEEIPAHPRRVEIRYTTPAGDLASVKPRAGEGPEEAIARATGVRTVIVEKSSIRLEGATAVVTVCPKYSRT